MSANNDPTQQNLVLPGKIIEIPGNARTYKKALKIAKEGDTIVFNPNSKTFEAIYFKPYINVSVVDSSNVEVAGILANPEEKVRGMNLFINGLTFINNIDLYNYCGIKFFSCRFVFKHEDQAKNFNSCRLRNSFIEFRNCLFYWILDRIPSVNLFSIEDYYARYIFHSCRYRFDVTDVGKVTFSYRHISNQDNVDESLEFNSYLIDIHTHDNKPFKVIITDGHFKINPSFVAGQITVTPATPNDRIERPKIAKYSQGKLILSKSGKEISKGGLFSSLIIQNNDSQYQKGWTYSKGMARVKALISTIAHHKRDI